MSIPKPTEPILIWGAGAIGSTLGACLVRAGHSVVFVDNANDYIQAIMSRGLSIEGPITEFNSGSRA